MERNKKCVKKAHVWSAKKVRDLKEKQQDEYLMKIALYTSLKT